MLNIGKCKKHRKLLTTFFVSYSIVLIIPLFIGCVAYIKAEQMMEEEVYHSNTVMLTKISDIIDIRVREIEQLSLQVSLNPAIQQFLYVEQPLTEKELYEAALVVKNIAANKNVDSFVNELFIYYKNSESVFSFDARYPVEYFYEDVYSYKSFSYLYWHDELLPRYHYRHCIPATDMVAGVSKSKKMVTFMSSMPLGQKFNPLATIIMMIDEQKFENMLYDIEPRGSAYIVDKDDRIIAATSQLVQQYMPDYHALYGNQGFINKKINGESMAISYITSSYTGWKYVSVVPMSVYMVKVNSIRNITFGVVGICLIVGLAMAYIFTAKNYNPIVHIAEKLLAFTGKTPSDNRWNEINFIEQTVTEIMNKDNYLVNRCREITEQNRKYEKQLNINGPLIKNGLLLKLIRDKMDNYETVIGPLKSCGINFSYDNYAVMIFHINNCNNFIMEGIDQDWNMVRFMITNVAEELANEQNKGYVAELEYDKLALIMNFPTGNPKYGINGTMFCIAKSLNDLMEKEYGIALTVAIGGVHVGLTGIRLSYEEASEALEYRIIRGNGTIITYDDITDRDDNYYYPMDEELKLINCIKIGDINAAEDIINRIIDKNLREYNLSVEMVRCLFFDIMGTAIKILDEVKVDYRDVFRNDETMDRLLKSDDVDKMCKEIKGMYKDIFKYIAEHKKNHSNELLDNIMQYIDQHHMDENISQAYIAEYFGITAPYLSRLFKQKTGLNMVDYINSVRVAKAKVFLQDPDLLLHDVAKRVGFSSDLALIRVFKKYEGITPGKFRETLRA